MKPSVAMSMGLVGITILLGVSAEGQDHMSLRINEVIADNETREPRDVGFATTDMVEIYNPTGETIDLGASGVALSDTETLDGNPILWVAPVGLRIFAESFIVVFCDGNTKATGGWQDDCEPHAPFAIASDGSEPITLWGPPRLDGSRDIIDQVWLPPLPPDASFGRFPDGFGPAPVPLGDVLSTFVFHPPGATSFGSCTSAGVKCRYGLDKRYCLGGINSSGGNLPPRVELVSHSTGAPGAGEALQFVVKVEDEKEPLAPNIASVSLFYRVNGGPDQAVSLVLDAAKGIQHRRLTGPNGEDLGPSPFNVWTEWGGSIPAQPAGSRVEFYFECRDADGGIDTSPETLCPEGVGPCDREFGGPGCQLDGDDITCVDLDCRPDPDNCETKVVEYREGVRYESCQHRFTYVVAGEPPEPLRQLVINEVVASQTGTGGRILMDLTDGLKECEPAVGPGGEALPADHCKYDDFIEIHNASDAPIDLSGLWLSDDPFRPWGWQFPPGSAIEAGAYEVVWVDGDGGRCPATAPPDGVAPCFWDCPDPRLLPPYELHASFSLNADSDQIYLFDTASRNHVLIHGVSFEDVPADHSLSLVPDGDPLGCWVLSTDAAPPTPGAANLGECPRPKFLRGDSNSDCRVDITDAVFILNWLFTGGARPQCLDAADANDTGKIDISDGIFVLGYLFLGTTPPPAPGPKQPPGPDATETDDLEACVPPDCS